MGGERTGPSGGEEVFEVGHVAVDPRRELGEAGVLSDGDPAGERSGHIVTIVGCGEDGNPVGEAGLEQEVIAIKKAHPRRRCPQQPRVACCAQPGVHPVADHLDAVVVAGVAGGDGSSGVGRGVVDDDDPPVGVRLTAHGVETVVEESLVVERRHNNGHRAMITTSDALHLPAQTATSSTPRPKPAND